MLLKDISRAIERQYSRQLLDARRIIVEIEHLGPRVVRSVIHLAAGELERLKYYAERALQDPRDVMWWAEYDRDSNTKVRNFNDPLE